MTYRARPVIVVAWKITRVSTTSGLLPATVLYLEDGRKITPSPDMLTRITPKKGDYYVIQQDGYTYLNPREVFERKYEPVETGEG